MGFIGGYVTLLVWDLSFLETPTWILRVAVFWARDWHDFSFQDQYHGVQRWSVPNQLGDLVGHPARAYRGTVSPAWLVESPKQGEGFFTGGWNMKRWWDIDLLQGNLAWWNTIIWPGICKTSLERIQLYQLTPGYLLRCKFSVSFSKLPFQGVVSCLHSGEPT